MVGTMRLSLRLAACGLGVLVGATPALATSPVGQWDVTLISDGAASGRVQAICFKQDGSWYSPTFSDYWAGYWLKKGERFRWAGEDGHGKFYAYFGQLFGARHMGGESAGFWPVDEQPYLNGGSWFAVKTSATCAPPP